MNATAAAAQIAKAYRTASAGRSVWLKMTDVAAHLDMTIADFTAGVQHLAYSGQAEVMPESNQKTLKEIDRTYQVWLAGENNHLITMD